MTANIEIAERAGVLDHDEIKTFMDSRYVSAPEAIWRLFEFHMHEQSHTIVRLPVHLPDSQTVYFNENDVNDAVKRAAIKDTKLTAWFKLNQSNLTAREFLYSDVPQHFVFDTKKSEWNVRKRGGENTIGRMYSVSLSGDTERYCLRLLLLHVKGATSFEDLRTVNNQQYDTFKEAAQKKCLFNDDSTWKNTLDDGKIPWR